MEFRNVLPKIYKHLDNIDILNAIRTCKAYKESLKGLLMLRWIEWDTVRRNKKIYLGGLLSDTRKIRIALDQRCLNYQSGVFIYTREGESKYISIDEYLIKYATYGYDKKLKEWHIISRL